MRSRLLLSVLVVVLALLAAGSAIQESKTVFFDNFDTTPKPEWEPAVGTWSAISGQYTIGKDIGSGKVFGALVDSQSSLTQYVIEVDVNFGATGSTGIYGGQGQTEAYIFVRAQDIDNGIVLALIGRAATIEAVQWRVRQQGEWAKESQKVSAQVKPGEVAHVRVEIQGTTYRAILNEQEITSLSNSSFTNATKIGVGFWYQSWNFIEGKRTTFDNFKLESTEAKTSVQHPSASTSTQEPAAPSALEARVATLESKISGLQSTLETLSARVAQLEKRILPSSTEAPPSSATAPLGMGERVERLEKWMEEIEKKAQAIESSATLSFWVSVGAATLVFLILLSSASYGY